MEPEAIARALAKVGLFGALPEVELLELAGRMRPRRFARSEVVFHRDDPANHLFVILSGSVKVSLPDETGRETLVALEREGEMFGELALFDDSPRSATVTALAETTTLVLARVDFLEVLERSPRAMRQMLGLLARTIRRVSGRVEDLVFLDIPSRVAKCLLDLTELGGGQRREVSLTQDDLAAFVGATRVSVNRALADLEGRGLIAVSRRHIEIRDPVALRAEIRY